MNSKALEKKLTQLQGELPDKEVIHLTLFFSMNLSEKLIYNEELDEETSIDSGDSIDFNINKDTKLEFIENTLIYYEDTFSNNPPTWQLVDLDKVIYAEISYVHGEEK